MEKDPPIVCFGEILWDLLPTGPVLGGAPFNLAYRIHSLGHPTVMVSRLGRDDRGNDAIARVAALGLETAFIQWDGRHPTGTVIVTFDERGGHDFTIVPDVAYDHITADQDLVALVGGAQALCFGSLIRRNPESARTLARLLTTFRGRHAFLDLNLRKDCWTDAGVIAAIADAEILKLNDDELATVDRIFGLPGASIPDKVSGLLKMTRLGCVVVTLGRGGAYAATRVGVTAYERGFDVPMVDTIGAGDAFAAGFLHRHLAGSSLAESCRFGNALGALVTAQRGATEPAGADRIDEMLALGTRGPVDPRFG
jgi:fructokinase